MKKLLEKKKTGHSYKILLSIISFTRVSGGSN